MRVGLRYKGRRIVLKDVKKLGSIGKAIGLMFKSEENAKQLLFDFGKLTKQPIHSLFCPEFIAVWFDADDKIIEIRKIKPWKLHIVPKKPFVKLIEIPINKRYEKNIKFLVGG